MRKFRFSVLLVAIALMIATVGSAAMSSISFDRNTAGQVLVDTDPNVAVQITGIAAATYPNLVKTEADGKVSINLNEAINNNTANGFNTDATFSIGTASSGVIKIKNNSDIPVTVTLTNDAGNTGALTLVPVTGASATIAVGSSSNFYFTVNTNGQDVVSPATSKALGAILHVAG